MNRIQFTNTVLNKYSLLELGILRLSFLLDSKYPPHMAPDIHQYQYMYKQ